MYFSSIGRWLFIAAVGLFAMPAAAAVSFGPETVVGDIMQLFEASQISDTILEAAKSLFWSLALISLVWTMGMLIVRQDIGELLMELLRFIIVTGLFYWVLVNASSRQGGQGFVQDIVMSFLGMVNDQASDESFRKSANDILARCLHVFFMVINETADGQDADRLIVGAMVTMIVCIGAVMAAQFLIALVMAWILGYAGIFLLGFGGARWTSPIAVNYYKHVVAVGIAMLALSLIGAITASFIDELGLSPNGRNYSKFDYLGLMLVVMILMQALAIKVPQLLYTLVTGSTLGLYAGSANAAGTAIAAAGSSAYSTAFSRPYGGGGAGGSGAPLGPSSGPPGHRTESVMDAVQRSASATGGMADPFHVHSGADPFGVRRAPDPVRGGRGGSVFGNVSVGAAAPAPVTEPLADAAGVSEVSASGTRDAYHAGRPDREAGNEMPTGPAAGSVPAAQGPRVTGNHSGRSVDAGVERGTVTVDRDLEDAIVQQQHSASVSGHQDASGQAVEDLRARTLSASEPSIEAHIDTSATIREEASGIVGDVPPGSGRGTGWHGSSLPEVRPGSMPDAGTAPAVGHPDDTRWFAGHADRKVKTSDVRHATSPTMESALHDTELHAVHSGASATHDWHTLNSTTPLPDAEVNDAQARSQDIHDHDVRSVEVHHAGGHGTIELDTPVHIAGVHNASAQDTVIHNPDMRNMQFAPVRPPADTAVARTSAANVDVASISTRETDSPVVPDLVDRRASPTTVDSPREPVEAPTTSIAQDDMKATRSVEEAQVVMPGATVETPVSIDAHVLPDTAGASGEIPPLGRKQDRMLRKLDHAPSPMPSVDGGERPQEDQP
ncbi:P-type conjugative transfer protein TrbL [Luteibacter sp. SG786]|uniref:P-type conjugative transfer protein TrbL n=1 Tax=Luteibacter sp. SG786 TaxID=2587130 RepID=UPI0014225D57|nr:P-type conjugative transfer protein TrbL [Luteibacter sp. SG786]NII55477.1 P-type conjugative transfer protein TrbL [Luteibacter sp. SG786]